MKSGSLMVVASLVLLAALSGCGRVESPPAPTLVWGEQESGARHATLEHLDVLLEGHGLPRVDPPLPPLEEGTARAFYEALLRFRRDPDAENIGAIGVFFHEYERDALAAACYRKAQENAPHALWAHYLGDLAERAGDMNAAVASFEEAARLAPDDAGPHVRLARLHRDRDAKKRRHHLDRALALAPESVFAMTGLAESALEEGRESEARELLEHAFELKPDRRRVNVLLARIHRTAGRLDLARRHEARAVNGVESGLLAIDPAMADIERRTDSLFRARALAEELQAARDWPRLLSVLEDIQRRAPSLADRVRIGQVHMYMGRTDVAQAMARAAIAEASTSPAGHELLARVHLRSGRGVEAVACAGRALALDDGSRPARETLVRALLSLGRFPEAQAAASELIGRDPGRSGPRLLAMEVHRVWCEDAERRGWGPLAAEQAREVRRLRDETTRLFPEASLASVHTWLAGR